MKDAPWAAFFAGQAFLFVGAVIAVIAIIGGICWLAIQGLLTLFA